MQPTENPAKTAAAHVARQLNQAGFQAYFAGGCVRDSLLGLKPKDYDITTSATPEEVTRIFQDADQVGAHFGVVIAKAQGYAMEIATFRTDGSYSDGRRPDKVEFATAEEDASRRDFTINGLFEDPESGEIIDHVGGLEDLKNKTLRAIGDPEKRFGEDSLRLMRAIRFATRLDLEIHPDTLAAIKNNAPSLSRVAPERIRDEFSRIITGPNRVRGLNLLEETGLLEQFMPEFKTLDGCDQSPDHHPEGDVRIHTLMMMGVIPENASLELALATLLHDIGKPGTQAVTETGKITFHGHETAGVPIAQQALNRLRYPNSTIEKVSGLVEKHMRPHHCMEMRQATIRRMLGWEHVEDLLELHKADCLCSTKELHTHEYLLQKKEELGNEPALPPRIVTGSDLIALGMTPGPEFRKILDEAQTEQLEGRIHTKEDGIKWLKNHGIHNKKKEPAI